MIRKNRNLNIDPYWFLEATVHQEGSNIFNLAYRLCRDREEAKEIARATFLKALENYLRFESRFHIYIFLCRTTFRIWKKRAGRRRRYPAQPLRSSGPISSGAVVIDPGVSLSELGREAQLQVLRKGLTSLPAPDNFIIILRDVEGKSYLEIACILKCRYHTVKSQLAQARKRLHANILPKLNNSTIISHDCYKNSELFSAQLDSLLLQSNEKNLQKHLKDCRECRKTFQEMEIIQKLLAGIDSTKPPDDLEAGILKTAKEKIARKSAPRYRFRYISYGLGSVTLALILLVAFIYPKLIPKNGLVVTSQTSSKNALSPIKKSIIAENVQHLETESFRSAPPPHTVIRNEKEWVNIWRLQNAGRNISTFLPEVDFSSKMVVVIISQDDKSEYTITGTEENKNETIIECEGTLLTHKNPPLPLYQFRIVDAKPAVTFKMVREE